MERITTGGVIASILLISILIIFAFDENCDDCFEPPMMALKFLTSGLVIMFGMLFYRTRYGKIEDILFRIDRQPILKTSNATEGTPFLGTGIVEASNTLNTPYSKTPCVYYHSILEQYVEKDTGGNWEMKEHHVDFVPFYLKDERGKIRVDVTNMDEDFSTYNVKVDKTVPNPKNSEIDCQKISQTCYTEKGKVLFVETSKRMRKTEYALTPGTQIMVYGMVSKRENELTVHEDENNPLIITRKGREEYINEFAKGDMLAYYSHYFIALGFTLFLFGINYFLNMQPNLFTFLLFGGNAFIIGTVIFTIYNRILVLEERMRNSLSNIEIEQQRRKDLIPNIVSSIKNYARYEKKLNNIIAESRVKITYNDNQKQDAAPAIISLIANLEQYPDLKASKNFQENMKALMDTEERIAYSKAFFNRSVLKYNMLIDQYPFVLIAALMNKKKRKYIAIEKVEMAAPKV